MNLRKKALKTAKDKILIELDKAKEKLRSFDVNLDVIQSIYDELENENLQLSQKAYKLILNDIMILSQLRAIDYIEVKRNDILSALHGSVERDENDEKIDKNIIKANNLMIENDGITDESLKAEKERQLKAVQDTISTLLKRKNIIDTNEILEEIEKDTEKIDVAELTDTEAENKAKIQILQEKSSQLPGASSPNKEKEQKSSPKNEGVKATNDNFENICDKDFTYYEIKDIAQQTNSQDKDFSKKIACIKNFFSKVNIDEVISFPLLDVYNVISKKRDKEYFKAFWREVLMDKAIGEKYKAEFDKKLAKKMVRVVKNPEYDSLELPLVCKQVLDYAKAESIKKTVKKIIGVACAIAIAVCVIFALSYIPNPATVVFKGEERVELTYGEKIDFSKYTVEYKRFNRQLITTSVNESMVSSYDSEAIGEQVVQLNFKGKTFVITVNTKKALLALPQVTINGNNLTWQAVDNALSYDIYYFKGEEKVFLKNTTECKFDISTTTLEDNVKLCVEAKNNSGKFSESISTTIECEKLKAVEGLTYSDGKFSWKEVVGASYYTLIVNDNTYDKITDLEYAYQMPVGEINVSVRANVENCVSSSYVSQNYVKLKAPQLAINDGLLTNDSTSNVVYYINDVEFDGDLTKIKDGGVYIITAIALTSGGNEITSEKSSNFVVTKLDKPTVTVAGESVKVNSAGQFKYFLDGNEFNGSLPSDLVEGDHKITAMEIATKNNQINSEISEEYIVTKLSKPNVRYNSQTKKVEIVSNGENCTFYINGVAFNGDLSNLTVGDYEITAKNLGNGRNILTSSEVTLSVFVSDIEPTVTIVDSNRVNVFLKTELTQVLYDISVDFEKNGSVIDSVSYKNNSEKTQTIVYNRGGTVANKLKIKITIYSTVDKTKAEEISLIFDITNNKLEEV